MRTSIRNHAFAEVHGKEYEIRKRYLAIAIQIVQTVEIRVTFTQPEMPGKKDEIIEPNDAVIVEVRPASINAGADDVFFSRDACESVRNLP